MNKQRKLTKRASSLNLSEFTNFFLYAKTEK